MWLFRCIICWLLLLPGMVQGQFNNNFWLFGDSAGINWTNPANPVLFKSMIRGRGSCVSLSDSTGIRIYSHSNYTTSLFNQSKTYNRYNDPINGSDSLYVEAWYHEMLLIPCPDSDSLVYLFTVGVNTFDGLYYTLVNYKANNDSGIVLQKNVTLQQVPAFDGLTAVQHGNGRDWWILYKTWDQSWPYVNNNTFSIYLLNENGVFSYQTITIGSLHNDGGGQIIFNSNGNQFCLVTWGGLIELFDFDRCTGQISNPINIEQFRSAPPYPYYFSAAYSSDDSKLYVVCGSPINQPGQNDTLFQFDLTASNIAASKQVIAVMSSYEASMANMKLAPDNKIYITTGDEIASIPYPDSLFTSINNNLSVINYPDSLGAACNFQPFSFNLGTGRTYYGLPNNPDYELGAWVGSPCDTLTTNLTPNPSPEARGAWMQAWYNHEWDMIHVNASKLQGKKGVLRLFDMEGRVVFEKQAEVISGGYFTTEINMSGLANGVYMVNLVTEKEKISSKIGKY
jgi:Secretion system C-terminal sorting domain